MSIGGILLGLINIAIVIAILLLVGAVILWGLTYIQVQVPEMVRRLYIVIVVLVAIYMVVALLLGFPVPRVVGSY